MAHSPVIGLVPAAGHARRLGPLPCSKELYPVGFHPSGHPRTRAACHYLLGAMRLAGVDTAYVVLRPGKWDIPAYLGDGALFDLRLAYLVTTVPWGVPYTLDQAYPFVRHALVAFGFPDILFEPAEAFAALLDRQAATRADVVLGLFPHADPGTADMVEADDAGRVRSIVARPVATHLRHAWVNAVWTPRFTSFMHEHLAARPPEVTEPSVGDVLLAALDGGLHVDSHTFPAGVWVDIGTPEGLVEALRTFG